MSWFATNFISAFLLPPFNLLLLAVAGLLLLRSRPRAGRILLTASLASLWLISTPYISGNALYLLESGLQPADPETMPADAIVVLGGGTYANAPEYGNRDTASEAALVRLRYAARLQRETGKPILLSGGNPLGHATAEAQQMKAALEQEFNIPARWTEDKSNNTMENARYSYQLLQEAHIRRIYLVTHAWHMPRAIQAFQAAGFEVIPAPTIFSKRYRTGPLNLIPSAGALWDSRIVMHELIGMLWYRLKS